MSRFDVMQHPKVFRNIMCSTQCIHIWQTHAQDLWRRIWYVSQIYLCFEHIGPPLTWRMHAHSNSCAYACTATFDTFSCRSQNAAGQLYFFLRDSENIVVQWIEISVWVQIRSSTWCVISRNTKMTWVGDITSVERCACLARAHPCQTILNWCGVYSLIEFTIVNLWFSNLILHKSTNFHLQGRCKHTWSLGRPLVALYSIISPFFCTSKCMHRPLSHWLAS